MLQITLDDEEQREDLAVIELYNPMYNPEAKTLKYDITAENETATTTSSIDLPNEFGQSTLVIDNDDDINHHHVICDGSPSGSCPT